MSQENVDAFKRGIEAANRRDIDAVLEELDPEVEWHPAILTGLGGEAAVYRGHEGFRQGIRDVYEALGETHQEYPEIHDLGDRIVVIGRIRARGRESRVETDSPHASVVDFKNGKAIRIRSYLDPKDALEAATLSE
jgi:ketosteroid isomerase-like protein